MAQVQSVETVTVPAAADLSAHQFKLAQINATGQAALIASGGVRVDGVIGNKPTAAGQACELQVGGLVKAIAGAAVTPGAEVAANASGLAIAAVATNYVFGVYKGAAACAANDLISILVDKYKI